MEILPKSRRLALLEYLHHIKLNIEEWLIIETRLTEIGLLQTNSDQIAEILNTCFAGKEGRVLVCNASEVLMLIHWGKESNKLLTQEIRARLPDTVCEIDVRPPTKEGLVRIKLSLAPLSAENEMYSDRVKRAENVILLVDDDLFVRKLLTKALGNTARIIETAEGNMVMALYLEHNPDVVILDIHLPGLYGHEILKKIKAIDKNCFVIMHSADSTKENIIDAVHAGARGFLAKPFSKQRLAEVMRTCPTINI